MYIVVVVVVVVAAAAADAVTANAGRWLCRLPSAAIFVSFYFTFFSLSLSFERLDQLLLLRRK